MDIRGKKHFPHKIRSSFTDSWLCVWCTAVPTDPTHSLKFTAETNDWGTDWLRQRQHSFHYKSPSMWFWSCYCEIKWLYYFALSLGKNRTWMRVWKSRQSPLKRQKQYIVVGLTCQSEKRVQKIWVKPHKKHTANSDQHSNIHQHCKEQRRHHNGSFNTSKWANQANKPSACVWEILTN